MSLNLPKDAIYEQNNFSLWLSSEFLKNCGSHILIVPRERALPASKKFTEKRYCPTQTGYFLF